MLAVHLSFKVCTLFLLVVTEGAMAGTYYDWLNAELTSYSLYYQVDVGFPTVFAQCMNLV